MNPSFDGQEKPPSDGDNPYSYASHGSHGSVRCFTELSLMVISPRLANSKRLKNEGRFIKPMKTTVVRYIYHSCHGFFQPLVILGN